LIEAGLTLNKKEIRKRRMRQWVTYHAGVSDRIGTIIELGDFG
jgi:hypothetical protein